ncbi:DUF2197 domain-containing protein [Gottfriedia endophytica]|uniref:DUF2197 domain-containing protein n=1 Tax=Gottfriedia endophytica TaxID=2820819 RepID=UPI001FD7CE5D|nr:DUF2197 domain-containing protein [Gottfriedia endophytica]
MFSYEVICYSCRKKYKVIEGTTQYKQFKENKNTVFCCEDCNHKIRLDAIKNFFRYRG